jgi:hypothetical protein
MVINTWILSEALFHPLFSTDYWCTVIDAWLLQKVVVTGVVWPEKVAALHSCSLCWDDGCGPWLGACMVFCLLCCIRHYMLNSKPRICKIKF